nr:PH108-35 [Vibrio phage 1]
MLLTRAKVLTLLSSDSQRAALSASSVTLSIYWLIS